MIFKIFLSLLVFALPVTVSAASPVPGLEAHAQAQCLQQVTENPSPDDEDEGQPYSFASLFSWFTAPRDVDTPESVGEQEESVNPPVPLLQKAAMGAGYVARTALTQGASGLFSALKYGVAGVASGVEAVATGYSTQVADAKLQAVPEELKPLYKKWLEESEKKYHLEKEAYARKVALGQCEYTLDQTFKGYDYDKARAKAQKEIAAVVDTFQDAALSQEDLAALLAKPYTESLQICSQVAETVKAVRKKHQEELSRRQLAWAEDELRQRSCGSLEPDYEEKRTSDLQAAQEAAKRDMAREAASKLQVPPIIPVQPEDEVRQRIAARMVEQKAQEAAAKEAAAAEAARLAQEAAAKKAQEAAAKEAQEAAAAEAARLAQEAAAKKTQEAAAQKAAEEEAAAKKAQEEEAERNRRAALSEEQRKAEDEAQAAAAVPVDEQNPNNTEVAPEKAVTAPEALPCASDPIVVPAGFDWLRLAKGFGISASVSAVAYVLLLRYVEYEYKKEIARSTPGQEVVPFSIFLRQKLLSFKSPNDWLCKIILPIGGAGLLYWAMTPGKPAVK